MKSHFKGEKRILAGCAVLCGAFGIASGLFLTTAAPVKADGGTAKIHLITFPGSGEAVVLESTDENGNPIFGMVDTGEDNDYPNGSDKRYPARSGIVIGNGNEEQVYSYLESLGVNSDNLKFIVCTHPHSDHIGLADSLIRDYSPDTVYLMEYSDECNSNPNTLWDNLYVYDQTVEACQETEGVNLVQHLEGCSEFSFGSFTINIVNYDEDYLTEPKDSANEFCLGVIATANGHTAFLSSDMTNTDGDLDRVVAEYGLSDIDVMTSNHHGYANANDLDYLEELDPDYYLQDGKFTIMANSALSTLAAEGTKVYSGGGYYGTYSGLVADMSGETVSCNADQSTIIYSRSDGTYRAYEDGLPVTGLFEFNGAQYCADENGTLRCNIDWTNPDDGLVYTFDSEGKVINIRGAACAWVKVNGIWYYKDENGDNFTGWLTDNGHHYYLKEDGTMATGWYRIDDEWYYFASWGGLRTGWQKIDGYWYYLDPDNNGVMLKDMWFEDTDGYIYHLASWGGAACNCKKTIDGTVYTFNKSCRISEIAWLNLDDQTYLIVNGKYYSGWAHLKAGYYYLNKDHTLKRDELFWDSNYLYYVDQTGLMACDTWVKVGESWYYFRSWGGAYRNTWYRDAKKIWYWLNEDGTMAVGWKEVNGKTYYFRSWGGMVTGTYTIEDKEYTFDKYGALVEENGKDETKIDPDTETTSTESTSTDTTSTESAGTESKGTESAGTESSDSESADSDSEVTDKSSDTEQSVSDSEETDSTVSDSEDANAENGQISENNTNKADETESVSSSQSVE